jgi:hypothetical protein
VTAQRQWKRVGTDALGYPEHNTSSTVLREFYETYLLPFETAQSALVVGTHGDAAYVPAAVLALPKRPKKASTKTKPDDDSSDITAASSAPNATLPTITTAPSSTSNNIRRKVTTVRRLTEEEILHYASLYAATGVAEPSSSLTTSTATTGSTFPPVMDPSIAPLSSLALYVQEPRQSSLASFGALSTHPPRQRHMVDIEADNINDDTITYDVKDTKPIAKRMAQWEETRVIAALRSGQVGPVSWALNQLLWFSYQTRTLPLPPVSSSSITATPSPSSSAADPPSTSTTTLSLAPLHSRVVHTGKPAAVAAAPKKYGGRGNKKKAATVAAPSPPPMILGGLESSRTIDDVTRYVQRTRPIVSAAIPLLLDSLIDLLKCGTCNNHYLDCSHPTVLTTTINADNKSARVLSTPMLSTCSAHGQLERIASESIERQWPDTTVAVLTILINMSLHPINVAHILAHARSMDAIISALTLRDINAQHLSLRVISNLSSQLDLNRYTRSAHISLICHSCSLTYICYQLIVSMIHRD